MRRFHTLSILTVCLGVVLALSSISSGFASRGSDGVARTTPKHVVKIVRTSAGTFAFSPATIKVKVGQTVTWKNSTGTEHSATANNFTSFDTGTIPIGGKGTPPVQEGWDVQIPLLLPLVHEGRRQGRQVRRIGPDDPDLGRLRESEESRVNSNQFRRSRMKLRRYVWSITAVLALVLVAGAAAYAQRPAQPKGSFLGALNTKLSLNVGTTPHNGDGNPYGVAIVPKGFPAGGRVHSGDILVSNFNNAAGKQGLGRTIVAASQSGKASLFFSAPRSIKQVGLTTALYALRSGIVVVGSMPTTDGTSGTVTAGSLMFLSKSGSLLLNLQDSQFVDGPWDMTADDRVTARPVLYVSNVLNGTVTRIDLHVVGGDPTIESMTRVASGFPQRADPSAVWVGPTGLLLSKNDRSLYVADTDSDAIRVLHGIDTAKNDSAGRGSVVISGPPLEGPLGLAWAPNGNIVTSNGDAVGPSHTKASINRVVEISPSKHKFVKISSARQKRRPRSHLRYRHWPD